MVLPLTDLEPTVTPQQVDDAVARLARNQEEMAEELEQALVPRSPDWDKGCIVEIRAAAGGEEALDALGRDGFDVAVVDLRLPGMDGEAFMARASKEYPGLRFVVYTGAVGYSPPGPVARLGVTEADLDAARAVRVTWCAVTVGHGGAR